MSDENYHARREREHRALASAATTQQAKLAHHEMAERHATMFKVSVPLQVP